jgi:uncharacterized membrane protein required for colicin V production
MPSVDVIAATIVLLAFFRGFMLGFVREAFSLGALAAASVAANHTATPFGEFLSKNSGGRIAEWLGPWIAGAVVAVVAIAAVSSLGRRLRRHVRAAGFSWFDRLGGGALGAGEGALVVCLLVAVGAQVVGRDHASLAGSRSLETLETLEGLLAARGLPHELPVQVAAPPPGRKR